MKGFALACMPWALCATMLAQGAPDFTTTDTGGQSHHLYAYLDAGKYVVLQGFGVTCGVCIAEVPEVNAMYHTWGCNTGDVVVLGITPDAQAAVQSFKAQHGVEYPLAGQTLAYFPNQTPTFTLVGPGKTIVGTWYGFEGIDAVADTLLKLGVLPPAVAPCRSMGIDVGNDYQLSTCTAGAGPWVSLLNMGNSALYSVGGVYRIDGGAWQAFGESFGAYVAYPGDLRGFVLPAGGLAAGAHVLVFTVTSVNGLGAVAGPGGVLSDTVFWTVQHEAGWPAGYYADFSEGGAFPWGPFEVEGSQGGLPVWETGPWGKEGGDALRLSNGGYVSSNSNDYRRLLWSYDLRGYAGARLYFDRAYGLSGGLNPGLTGLNVWMSTTCGGSWTLLGSRTFGALATPGLAAGAVPGAGDWVRDSVGWDLGTVWEPSRVVFRFTYLYQMGQHTDVYLDNIRLAGAHPVGVGGDVGDAGVGVYPNPLLGGDSGGVLYCGCVEGTVYRVLSATGAVVAWGVYHAGRGMGVGGLAAGVYWVELTVPGRAPVRVRWVRG